MHQNAAMIAKPSAFPQGSIFKALTKSSPILLPGSPESPGSEKRKRGTHVRELYSYSVLSKTRAYYLQVFQVKVVDVSQWQY